MRSVVTRLISSSKPKEAHVLLLMRSAHWIEVRDCLVIVLLLTSIAMRLRKVFTRYEILSLEQKLLLLI